MFSNVIIYMYYAAVYSPDVCNMRHEYPNR